MKDRIPLRRGDGIGTKLAHFSTLVEEYQAVIGAEPDGQFGAQTEAKSRSFQRIAGLEITGEADAATWAWIDEPLPGFRGSLTWIHAQEGHQDRPYWPGGASGVTLDPGADLRFRAGFIPLLVEAYGLSPGQESALRGASGLRGEDAKRRVAVDSVLGGIRTPREIAARLFPRVILPYWDAISGRFPVIRFLRGTPGAVQTAFLSLAYNRGAGNRWLTVLEEPSERRDWTKVATRIGAMQQSHKLPGIRRRRREESALIRRSINL